MTTTTKLLLILFLSTAPWWASPAAASAHEARTQSRETIPGARDFDLDEALAFSKGAIGRDVREVTFTRTDGTAVNLSAFRGKPLVLSFIYSSCTHACPVITETLAKNIAVARGAVGEAGFAVATVGFDTLNDTPAAMRLFAKTHGVDEPGWSVFTIDTESVERLALDTGFLYYRTPGGFDHLNQVTVIDAQGRVAAQIYGQTFEAPRLVEPLKRLIFGTSAPLASVEEFTKRVWFFCTIYDPALDRYRFDYSFFIGMFLGAIFFILAGTFLVRAWWRILRSGRPTT